MEKVNVKAPVGHHFMVKDDGAFYLMRTLGEYIEHVEGEYTSQLSVAISVRNSHVIASTRAAAPSTKRTTTTSNTTASSKASGRRY